MEAREHENGGTGTGHEKPQPLFGKGSKKRPELIDGSTGELVPIPSKRTGRINLHHISAVRQELARTYREVKAGKLESSEGSKRAYMLVQLAQLIEVEQLERRIEALEQQRIAAR